MRMTPTEIRKVLELCQYPGYTFHLTEVMYDSPYLVATYEERDVEQDSNEAAGKVVERVTQRWLLKADTTPSELVETALQCILTSLENRARAVFTYRGRPVMQPHHDVEMLVSVCYRAAELRKQRAKERRG